ENNLMAREINNVLMTATEIHGRKKGTALIKERFLIKRKSRSPFNGLLPKADYASAADDKFSIASSAGT
ncbi:hypothetical protein, partial [Bacillus glycinifermentans]|uniref:hypothetical protein n=1 Tax=Bacillus glycinifermentans TaxID=1664069 RepID=UPI001F3DFA6A